VASDEEKAVVMTVGCIIMLLATPFTAVLNGWVLSVLWAWFLVPLGVPAINVVTAIGVALVVAYMTYQLQTGKSDPDASYPFQSLFVAVFKPLFALGFGWVVHMFQ
jgi:hypothetical protein